MHNIVKLHMPLTFRKGNNIVWAPQLISQIGLGAMATSYQVYHDLRLASQAMEGGPQPSPCCQSPPITCNLSIAQNLFIQVGQANPRELSMPTNFYGNNLAKINSMGFILDVSQHSVDQIYLNFIGFYIMLDPCKGYQLQGSTMLCDSILKPLVEQEVCQGTCTMI